MFLHRFAELASTQDWAIEAAQAGRHELAVMADRQPAGRGRGGRVWQAPEGNLCLSMLLRPGPVPLQAAAWSLLAGVAVFEAVAGQGVHGLQLKWPNDLLAGGAKLAGVLIDSALTPAGMVDWVVIGVGVNIAEAPVLPDRAATCLAAARVQVAPETLAQAITAQIATWRVAGHAAVRAAWLERAHPVGTMLRVHDRQRVVEGAFAGLAPDGSLMLRDQAAISSGDVFLVGV